ncbi:hypothetical protein HN011_007650 [Eciton burchellii]|nr:hypothetical protein HN011_007650 [Eciton burchellii]
MIVIQPCLRNREDSQATRRPRNDPSNAIQTYGYYVQLEESDRECRCLVIEGHRDRVYRFCPDNYAVQVAPSSEDSSLYQDVLAEGTTAVCLDSFGDSQFRTALYR